MTKKMSGDTILTCSGYFMGCPWSCSLCVGGANVVDTRSSCAKDTCVGGNCSTKDTWVKAAKTEGAGIRNISVGGAGVGHVIKCLKIYFQSSQILELIQYSPEFKIGVRAG